MEEKLTDWEINPLTPNQLFLGCNQHSNHAHMKKIVHEFLIFQIKVMVMLQAPKTWRVGSTLPLLYAKHL